MLKNVNEYGEYVDGKSWGIAGTAQEVCDEIEKNWEGPGWKEKLFLPFECLLYRIAEFGTMLFIFLVFIKYLILSF